MSINCKYMIFTAAIDKKCVKYLSWKRQIFLNHFSLLKKKLHVTWVLPKIRVIARDGNEFTRYNSRIKSHERYPPGHTSSYPHLWSDAVHNNQFRHTPDRFTIRGIRRDSIQTRYKSRCKYIPQTAILLEKKLITINCIKDK